jgi:hypothetical protein
MVELESELNTTFTGVSYSIGQELKGKTYHSFGKWLTIVHGIFSIDYSLIYGERKIHFNIILTDKEAVELEEVLRREKLTRRFRFETYRCGGVYLTCMRGDYPIISFAEKGVSISFFKDEEYDSLLDKVTVFLDEKELDPNLSEQREKWKKDPIDSK